MAERRMEKLIAAYTPFPMCIVNPQGKVTRASAGIGEVFIYDGIRGADIFALTGIKLPEFIKEAKGEKALTLSRNEKTFRIKVVFLDEDEETAPLAIYFNDITNYDNLKEMYNNERMCMAVVNVDNFDELSSSTGVEKQLTVTSEIDKTIRQWAAKMRASVTRFKDHLYMLVFEYVSCEKMVESKFSILDDIRLIETEADFPVTLSIGIGASGKSPVEIEQFAQDALDLALGRGGDQAVIKKGSRIEYYGGKMQTVEKSNKGKSRVIAHALKQLIDQSDRVIVMGHKNPDMDSFGAALGIFRIAANIGKEAYIVVDSYNEALTEIYKQAKAIGIYHLINNEKAKSLADKDSLLVIVDTHRPSITECPELFQLVEKVAVIDHHRKAEEFIEAPILSYMESYASSTSELVTEMLQYSGDKKNVAKFEVEALLAGITVDTNRFAVKTGVRTFEAASWLRRSGADTTAVKRFFQTDQSAFMLRAACIANAKILDCNIAMSICEGEHTDAQIINSQAADELLTIKGIKASFVAGTDADGRTVISARSLGEVNVQIIMEKFGGGGHLTTAGAQVDIPPEEALEKLEQILKEKLKEE